MVEEETSMTKPSKLIILLLVLAALVGSYIFISSRPKENTKAQQDSEKIELSKLDESKITKMTLSSNTDNLVFEKKDNAWTMPDHPEMKLDQDAINALAKSFSGLYSDRMVSEDPNEFHNFGLKTPAFTATAVVEGGGETTLYIGNKTPQGNAYYAMLKDISKVYTIPAEDGRHFSYTLSDVRDKSVSNLNASEVNYINIVNKDGMTIELKKVIPGSSEEQEFGSDNWLILKPYKNIYTAESYSISDMTNSLGEMKISGFVEDNPEDYSKYGLDKPVMDITVKDNLSQVRLLFGKDQDEENIYFRIDGSKAVYAMEKSRIKAFNSKPFEIVNKELRFAQSSKIEKMTIEGLGRNNVYIVNRTVKPPANPEDKEIEELSFKMNGKDIEDGDFYLSFNTMMGLYAEVENDKQVDEKPELKITIDFYKGDKKQTVISYCPYNDDFYAVFKDGKADFLISKQAVNKALEQIIEIEDKYKNK